MRFDEKTLRRKSQILCRTGPDDSDGLLVSNHNFPVDGQTRKTAMLALLAEKRNFVSSQDLIFWNLAETMGSLFQRRPLASAAEDGRKHPTAGCALKRR